MMAIGVSLTWGMLKVINLAHFGLILIGAYLTYQTATSWGLDPLLTIVVTAPVLFVAGALLLVGVRPSGHQRAQLAARQLRLLVIIDPGDEHHLERGLPPDERRRQPVRHRVGAHRGVRLPDADTARLRRGGRAHRRPSSSRCVGRSSAGHCAPSPRTVRSPPPSASTTAGSVCCSPALAGASAARRRAAVGAEQRDHAVDAVRVVRDRLRRRHPRRHRQRRRHVARRSARGDAVERRRRSCGRRRRRRSPCSRRSSSPCCSARKDSCPLATRGEARGSPASPSRSPSSPCSRSCGRASG